MKLTDALCYVLISLTLGLLGFLVQAYLPGGAVAVFAEFSMILSFAVMLLGVAHLVTGQAPCNFSGRMIVRTMLLPLLYLLIGIIFVDLVNGATGKVVLMNLLDWLGFFFVMGMTMMLGCKSGGCCKH